MDLTRLKKLAGIDKPAQKILTEQPLSIAGVDHDIAHEMIDKSASWLKHYRKPGTSPLDAIDEWLASQSWNAMKEMWRHLPMNSRKELARHIVGMNVH